MRVRSKQKLMIVAGIALVATCVACLLTWTARQPAAPGLAAAGGAMTVLPETKMLTPFALEDHEGRRFDAGRLRGAWTLLFFGFTSCPDICPTTLADLARLRRALAARGDDSKWMRIVFVSVDPGRDDRATLARYVRFFDPSLTGVTGTPEELARLARQLGAAFEVLASEEPDYPVYHTTAVFVIDADARWRAVLRSPLAVEEVAVALGALRRASGD